MARKNLSSEGEPEGEGAVMSLGEHLEELRTRVIKCLSAVGVAFILCWIFRDQLRLILQRPHVIAMQAFEMDTSLKFSSYFEAVVAQLKACFIGALVLTAPILIYQVWAFVAPGLFRHERDRTLKLGAACVVCFAAGVGFGYFFFIPIALRYLLSLSGGWAEPVLMISRYLSLFFLLTLALGIAFQTPVVVYYLIRWGVLDVESFQKHRKGVVLGAFIVAAAITPPDPVTQIMMAVTLIVLYDLGGLLAAPSRATAKSFVKFTGTVVIVGVAFVAWYRLWPVAEVTALKGDVSAGGKRIATGWTLKVPRGMVCSTDVAGVARMVLGGSGGAELHLAGGTRLHVHSATNLSLYRGDALVRTPTPAVELTVRTGPARVVLAGSRAELSVPDQDTLTVTVFEGVAQAKAGGQTKHVAAGQSATFRSGGEPVDVSDAERRWQQLIQGGKEGEAAAPGRGAKTRP
ncbi:MAG: twin-arginine translocase subunit TatC [Planctomycetota bacterium]|jgi:Tat protein translocase TatC